MFLITLLSNYIYISATITFLQLSEVRWNPNIQHPDWSQLFMWTTGFPGS